MAGKLAEHIKGNVVAYVALFIALGGTSYAAINLPRNSVGSKQLRSNAVTSGKVRNGSLRASDFQAGALKRGPRGPQGPPGAGGTGTQASAKTVRGRFEATGVAPPTGATASGAISFGMQLPAAPARNIVLSGSTTQCPGTVADPEAAPGQLCIYVGDRVNNANIETITDSATPGGLPTVGGTSRQGAGIVVASAGPGTFGARGSWAVTAP
jgi:hypothetical protein